MSLLSRVACLSVFVVIAVASVPKFGLHIYMCVYIYIRVYIYI